MDAYSLVANLTLDSTEYYKKLDQAKSDTTKGSSGIGRALGAMGKIAGAALTASTTAMAAFGASSVKTGMQFDTAMSQVAATSGKTIDELQSEVGSVDLAWGSFSGNLRQYAQEMGAHTAFSATQAAEALNYMALAGYKTQESINMLPNVLNLAAAGNMDLARASDMVTDTQTAFGLKIEEMPQLIDEMAKAASTGNTSVEQLGDAFLTVGGLAQELNGGFVTLSDGTEAPVSGIQEMEIALTAMANAGIKGSEAGTHMRNMLLKLSSPTSDGAKQLEKLGVAVFDNDGNMRSLSNVMGDLSGKLGSLTQEQKIKAISDLFNTRDLASAEALLNAVGEDWDSIGESILDAQGSAQQMADTQLDNLQGDVTLFKSALEGAQIAVSDRLTPTLRQFVQFGSDAVTKLGDAFKKGGLTGAMDALGSILSDGLNMIIEQLPMFIKAGMDLLGALGRGLLDNLPVIIDSAVQIVSSLLEGLVSALPALADGALQIIVGLANGITEMLPELIPTIVDVVLQIVDTLIENVDMLVDAALQIITALADGLLNALPVLMEKAPTIIQKLIDALTQNFPKIIQNGVQIVLKLIQGIVQNLPALAQGAVQIISSLISYIAEHLPEIIQQGFELVVALIKGIGNAIPELIKAAWDIVNGLWQTVTSYDWLSIGRNVIDGISNGIRNAAGAVWEALKSAIKTAWDGALDFLGIASPSKKARDVIGKNWALGIGEGFKKYMPVDQMINSVASAFNEIEDIEQPELDYGFNNDMIARVISDDSGYGFASGGFEQTVNIYSPESLNPSEVARQTRLATQNMVLALRGV